MHIHIQLTSIERSHFILRLNRYEMVRVTESKPLPSEKERGLLNYLWGQVNKSISIFIFRFKKKNISNFGYHI